MERIFIVHPGAVAISATTQDDKLLLIKQFRAPVKEWLWEIPAGTLEIDEKAREFFIKLNEKLEVGDVLNESISTQKLNSKTVEKLFNSNKVNEEFIDLADSKVKGSKVIIITKDNMIIKFKDKITCVDKTKQEDTSIYFDTSKL